MNDAVYVQKKRDESGLMKHQLFSITWPVFCLLTCCFAGSAQEPGKCLTLSADFVSSFVWRGTKIGQGPAIQPTIEFVKSGFTAGTWGSYYPSDPETDEVDLYASYNFSFGLALGITDYYFPGNAFFDDGNHAFELNGSYQAGKFNLSANYIFNEGNLSSGRDTYFEASYSTGDIQLFLGAGNGWHTPDNGFAVCNLGFSVSKVIKMSGSFDLPMFGSLILNPGTERLHLVVGFTL